MTQIKTYPLISVVMPVYNGEKYLQEAIDSILNQTYDKFEFIILNDGSTDSSEDIILSYSDPRIKYVKNEVNLKIVKTLNKGVALSVGKYIARMDADDISLPERFEKQVKFLESNTDIDVCGSYIQTIGAKEYKRPYPITPESVQVAMLFYSPLAHPCVMLRKTFFDNQKYNSDYDGAEDYYLWASNIKKYKFYNISEHLLLYRLHENQVCTVYEKDQLELVNKIRLNLLNEFGVHPTEKEFTVHIKLSSNRLVDIYDAEKWLYKLYQKNKATNYFDEEALKTFIDNKWWIVINQSSVFGLKAFFYYYKSNQIKFFPKTCMQSIKLLVKCIVRYNVFKVSGHG